MKTAILLTLFMLASPWNNPDLPSPPGTMRVSKNFYIDKAPIAYIDYYEFLHHITIRDKSMYHSMIPADTTSTNKGKIMWNNPDFHDSPIIGLSKYQMNTYCTWRSDVVNQLILDPLLRCSEENYWAKFDDLDPHKEYKVVYSLLTTEDIRNVKLKRSSFDEQLADGIWTKNSKNTNLKNYELIAFRCKATFVPVE